MKRILALLIIVISFISCDKDKFYRIHNDTGKNGTITIYECLDDEAVDIIKYTFEIDQYKTFKADDWAEKIKIYIDDLDCWVQRVWYLNEGKFTYITIDNKTIVGGSKP